MPKAPNSRVYGSSGGRQVRREHYPLRDGRWLSGGSTEVVTADATDPAVAKQRAVQEMDHRWRDWHRARDHVQALRRPHLVFAARASRLGDTAPDFPRTVRIPPGLLVP